MPGGRRCSFSAPSPQIPDVKFSFIRLVLVGAAGGGGGVLSRCRQGGRCRARTGANTGRGSVPTFERDQEVAFDEEAVGLVRTDGSRRLAVPPLLASDHLLGVRLSLAAQIEQLGDSPHHTTSRSTPCSNIRWSRKAVNDQPRYCGPRWERATASGSSRSRSERYHRASSGVSPGRAALPALLNSRRSPAPKGAGLRRRGLSRLRNTQRTCENR